MNANVLSLVRLVVGVVMGVLVQRGCIAEGEAGGATESIVAAVLGVGAVAWIVWKNRKAKKE